MGVYGRIYEGTHAAMLLTTDAPVESVWTVTSGINLGNKYEYRGATAGWVQTHNATGGALVSPSFSAKTANSRTVYCVAGGAAVVPNTDLSAIAVADIIAWTNFEAGSKTVSFISTTADDGTANEMLGWWVTINAGSSVIAKQRLQEALDTATGLEISVYAVGATIQANENKGSFIVPRDASIQISNEDDILDIYVMPVAAVTGVGLNGFQLLSVILS